MTDVDKGIICPECGGSIGGVSDDQRPMCSCNAQEKVWRARPGAAVMREVNPSEDTDVVPSPAPEAPSSGKSCCVCGKDLTGHRRFKDSTGYYCKDCHKADKAANTPDERRCDGCGRKIRVAKLIPWADDLICSTCHKERLAIRKKEIEKARIAVIRRKHEFMGLRLWLSIFTVLALILFLRWMKIL